MVITASASMIEISPYFEPGAPPPTLPILIAQTEIGNAQTPGKLVAQEEIGSGPTVARLPYPKRHTTPSHFPLRSSTPKLKFTSKSSKRPNTTSVSLDESVNSESESSLSSLSDSESDDELLIPKPKGEAGRPGRGGYNLENTLGWEGKDYRKMKKYIRRLVEEHLDISKNFTLQSRSGIRNIADLARENFPILDNYFNCWPVEDFIRLELKYRGSRARARDVQPASPAVEAQPKAKPKTRKSSLSK